MAHAAALRSNGELAKDATGALPPSAYGGTVRTGRRDRTTRERRASQRFGANAEASIAQYLRAGGYDVLSRNERVSSCEVDLIAVRDDTVAFVEVKARKKGWDGLEAVTPSKQKRISRAANGWLARNPQYAGHTIRFDVALVWPGSMPDYLENAFEAVEADDYCL